MKLGSVPFEERNLQSKAFRYRSSRILTAFCWGVLLLSFGLVLGQSQRQEEQLDYFGKWLHQDVVYIISPEEREVFEKLQTAEEKEAFIEQFWRRRDTDPATAANEFKEEHYRRIAYANENFRSGIPGWKTDRGQIYIKFGSPDRIERNPTGGDYQRPSWEGGGSTVTHPFERWEYHYIEGIGDNIEIEFVDDTLSGEYRLTTNPDDKDALLHVPNVGLTEAENSGLVAQKIDRIVRKTSPMPGHNPLVAGHGRAKDQPFEKLQLVTNLNKAPLVDYSDLKRQVEARTFVNKVPFRIRQDVFRVGQQGKVILTLFFNSSDLSYRKLGGIYQARVDFYGAVRNLTGRIVTEVEDSLVSQVAQEQFQPEMVEPLVFQRDLLLPPGLYKLELLIKDVVAEQTGFREERLIVSREREDRLDLSSVILARRIETVPATQPDVNPAQLKIWPASGTEVPLAGGKIGFYFEIYNFQVDQATGIPALDLKYEILDAQGRVLQAKPAYHSADRSGDRLLVTSILSSAEASQGEYHLKIRLHDRISDQQVVRDLGFAWR